MTTQVLVRRTNGTTQWLDERIVALRPERWAVTGEEYGVKFSELYEPTWASNEEEVLFVDEMTRKFVAEMSDYDFVVRWAEMLIDNICETYEQCDLVECALLLALASE